MKRIGLSIGHNKHDRGALGKEFDIVKRIVDYVQGIVAKEKLYVPQTNGLWKGELSATIKALNSAKVDIALEGHGDLSSNEKRRGGIIIYVSQAGRKIAGVLAKHLNALGLIQYRLVTWNSLGRGFKSGFLYQTNAPAVIIEFGFVSNLVDRNILQKCSAQIGDALVSAIEELASG